MASFNMHLVKTAVLLVAVSTLVASRHRHNRNALYAENYRKASEFRCQEPQPRLIEAAELSHSLAGTDKIVIPHITVLHRCTEDCGFCHSDMRCGPAPRDEEGLEGTEETTLVFSVTKIGGKEAKLLVKVANHTRCACLPP